MQKISTEETILIKPAGEKIADERGSLQHLLDGIKIGSVLLIDSKVGAIRANHFHKKDWHFCILESGSMNYYERPHGTDTKPTKILIKPGQIFFTAPKTDHLMEFLEDSKLFCFSRLSRQQNEYESDTTRLDYDLRNV